MGTARTRSATTVVSTIASSASLSSTIDSSDYAIAAILMPSAWDTAAITFVAVGPNGAEWPVYDDAGTEVTLAATTVAAASRAIVNKAVLEQLAALGKFKIRSGTAGTPVNQTAARTILVVLKS